jgi:hypothetical protein
MKIGVVVVCLAAFGAAGLCLAEPEPVQACGMVFQRQDVSALLVATADKSLQAGDHATVVSALEDAVPLRLSGADADGTDARALRLMATAVVRSDGEVFTSDNGYYTRRQRLLWAVGMLESLEQPLQGQGEDPRLRTARAVGLSRLEGRLEDARRMLKDLAQRDLITSPSGWAALARLRDKAGDELGRNGALARCALMSERDEQECGPDASSLAGQALAVRTSS